MASTFTATQQRNSFSEGFALGLILKGRWALDYNKTTIDLAVTSAFRGWLHASAFPQIRTDLRGLDGVYALTRVDRGKQTFAFYWDTSGPDLKIVSRNHDWSDEVPDDVFYAVQMIGDLVPRAGWEALAAAFLKHFE